MRPKTRLDPDGFWAMLAPISSRRQPARMTPEMANIVEDAYRIFSDFRVRHSLSVCHCNCCMTAETEQELLKTPLRAIPASILAEYTNSAHGWDDGPIAREMRYFLPRYLELIAINEPPCHMGLDICLRRLGEAKWRETWPAAEEEALDRFFDALMRQSLSNLDLAAWPVGWRLAFDIADVLTLVVTAGGDLERVLAVWDGAADPSAAIHMAALREDVLESAGRTYLHSAYLDKDFNREADRIGAFLMRPEVDRRIEAAFFAVSDARLQSLLSDAMIA